MRDERDEAARHAVYVETTIISYLTAWPMREVVAAARQELTQQWWSTRRSKFDLFVSELVVAEAAAGDADAAERRLAVINDLSLLPVTEEAVALQERLLTETGFPAKARVDAGHIAIATLQGMNYLLTWNMTHIANAEFDAEIRDVCMNAGYEPPKICTPEELMGGDPTDV